MVRHAYLVTAYNNVPVLRILMRLLDDERNDLFVHIDAKSPAVGSDVFWWDGQRSQVTLVPRMAVHWGDYSQVRSILRLLAAAVPGRYAYYHLLSGSDLPLKNQDHIHNFFNRHNGCEFLEFNESYDEDWVQLHHWFNNTLRPRTLRERAVRRGVVKPLLRVERMWRARRPRQPPLTIRKGSDWWSISHALAEHLLEQEPLVERLFARALVPTEFYLQTLAWNSRFREAIYNPRGTWDGNLRHVDWGRGNPYTFRSSDLPELLTSDRLFARKFEWDVDRKIVERIRAHVVGAPSDATGPDDRA